MKQIYIVYFLIPCLITSAQGLLLSLYLMAQFKELDRWAWWVSLIYVVAWISGACYVGFAVKG